MVDYIVSEERIKFLETLACSGEIPELRERPLLEHDKQEHANFIASRCRCNRIDCMDYYKELCSPWKCSYYLRDRDMKIKQDAREEALTEAIQHLEKRRGW